MLKAALVEITMSSNSNSKMTGAVSYTLQFGTNTESWDDLSCNEANTRAENYFKKTPYALQIYGKESVVGKADVTPKFIFSEGFTSCVGMAFIDPATGEWGLCHISPYVCVRDRAHAAEDLQASLSHAMDNACKMLSSARPESPLKIMFFHGYSAEDPARLTYHIERRVKAVLTEKYPTSECRVLLHWFALCVGILNGAY